MPYDNFEKCMAHFHWRRMLIPFSFPAVAMGSARTDAEVVEHDRSCECEMLTAVALNN